MKTKKLVYIAVFIAIGFIFSRFLTFQTASLKIGTGYIPAILSSLLFGPIIGGVINAFVDIIGAVLIPKGGAYFPGFTLTAFMSGAIYGIFLYRRELTWVNLSLAVIINKVITSILINTYFISLLTGKGFIYFLSTRIPSNLIMIPIEIISFMFIYKYLQRTKVFEALKDI